MESSKENLAVELQGVFKKYGDFVALKKIDLEIKDNEFFTLLGPSGCGKTTLLRVIAGFEEISEGSILLKGERIGGLPPNKRPINTVFQHYALFPHMTVEANVAFGMKMLGMSKAEVADRSRKMLEMVKLGDFAERRPNQLSGGQQQRVALARAMAPGPQVLLLDEPLSALDLKLRHAMRVELKQLQMETGITFVFVTHDQEEALTMSDRIGVMDHGILQQVGTPHEIYEKPINRFVADFIGETNIFDATISHVGDANCVCVLRNGSSVGCEASSNPQVGTKCHLSIRPEGLEMSRANDEPRSLGGRVEQVVYLGTDTQYLIRIPSGELVTVRCQNTIANGVNYLTGDEVALKPRDGAARLLVD
ncbi:MAG: ABC transporter ATP-binding protein [Albidovulum sp.]|nr:ABC transporter ATP-binding protein [Albidovulum sp.]